MQWDEKERKILANKETISFEDFSSSIYRGLILTISTPAQADTKWISQTWHKQMEAKK